MFINKINLKQTIATVVSPFANAAITLLIILSFLEFFRRGFVSLFLDLRIVFVVALVLWATSVWSAEKRKLSWFTRVVSVLFLAALLVVLWKMTVSFGRLGLVVFGAGVLVAIIVIMVAWKNEAEPEYVAERLHSTLGSDFDHH